MDCEVSTRRQRSMLDRSADAGPDRIRPGIYGLDVHCGAKDQCHRNSRVDDRNWQLEIPMDLGLLAADDERENLGTHLVSTCIRPLLDGQDRLLLRCAAMALRCHRQVGLIGAVDDFVVADSIDEVGAHSCGLNLAEATPERHGTGCDSSPMRWGRGLICEPE